MRTDWHWLGVWSGIVAMIWLAIALRVAFAMGWL